MGGKGGGGALPLRSFLTFIFFRVRAFSISQTRLSQNQTGEKNISVLKQTRTRVDGAFISIGGQSEELK